MFTMLNYIKYVIYLWTLWQHGVIDTSEMKAAAMKWTVHVNAHGSVTVDAW